MIEFREDDPALRLDEILPGKKIFQYREGFAYGTDAVLLSRFIKPPHAKSVGVEFGTGTGIIPLLLLWPNIMPLQAGRPESQTCVRKQVPAYSA